MDLFSSSSPLRPFASSSRFPADLQNLWRQNLTTAAGAAAGMEFKCSDIKVWKEALSSYPTQISSLNKPNLLSLDNFYCNELPSLLHSRQPNPYVTKSELSSLMQWKLTRGKFRPRLLDYVKSLDEDSVKSASGKAFLSLPDLPKAVSDLTVLKGVGPATASALLAAYAPDVAPFMSDEAMEAALGNSKDYTLKQYLVFADKLQKKAKELSSENEVYTASDVERSLWSAAIAAKLLKSQSNPKPDANAKKNSSKRKRK